MQDVIIRTRLGMNIQKIYMECALPSADRNMARGDINTMAQKKCIAQSTNTVSVHYAAVGASVSKFSQTRKVLEQRSNLRKRRQEALAPGTKK